MTTQPTPPDTTSDAAPMSDPVGHAPTPSGRKVIEWGPAVALLDPIGPGTGFERDQLASQAARVPQRVRAVRRMLTFRGDPSAVALQLGNSLMDGEHQGFHRGKLTIAVETIEDSDGRCTRPGLQPREADLALAQLRQLRGELTHLYPGDDMVVRASNLARDLGRLADLLDVQPEGIFDAAKNRVQVLVEIRKVLGMTSEHDPECRGRFTGHELHSMVMNVATIRTQHKEMVSRQDKRTQLLVELCEILKTGPGDSFEDIPQRVQVLADMVAATVDALDLPQDADADADAIRAAVSKLRQTANAPKLGKAAGKVAQEGLDAKRAIADLIDESPQDWGTIVKAVGELAKHASRARIASSALNVIAESIGMQPGAGVGALQDRTVEIITHLRQVRELLDFPVQAELFPGGVVEALRELAADAAAVQPICEALGVKVDTPIAGILTTIGELRAAQGTPAAMVQHNAAAEHEIQKDRQQTAQALADIKERLGMPDGAGPRDVVRSVELLLEDTGTYGKVAPEVAPKPMPGDADMVVAVCEVLDIADISLYPTGVLADQLRAVMVDRVSRAVAPVAGRVELLEQQLATAEERLLAAQRMTVPAGQPTSAAAGMIGCRLIGWLARTLKRAPTADEIEDFRKAVENSSAAADVISRIAATVDPEIKPATSPA